VVLDLAALLGIDPSLLKVVGLAAGSVVVHFELLSTATTAASKAAGDAAVAGGLESPAALLARLMAAVASASGSSTVVQLSIGGATVNSVVSAELSPETAARTEAEAMAHTAAVKAASFAAATAAAVGGTGGSDEASLSDRALRIAGTERAHANDNDNSGCGDVNGLVLLVNEGAAAPPGALLEGFNAAMVSGETACYYLERAYEPS
jgi:hypothetical protein